MPRPARSAPKSQLPLSLWIAGIGILALGVYISIQSRPRVDGSAANSTTALPVDSRSATFSDYFDSGWRSGATNSPILIEATYFFPELVAALNQLPSKSSHQGEIADRLSLAKANVDSIVFYVTLASGADPVEGLEPTELLSVKDSSGNTYKVNDWVEANAALLPASSITQRIGLLVVSRTADNGRTFEQNGPKDITLTATGISQSPQELRWDLVSLKNFLTHYERS